MEVLGNPSWLWGLSFIVLTIYHDPRGSCSDNGFRGDEDTSPIGNAKPSPVDANPDSDLCNCIDWTAIGLAARNRVRDLGSGVFVARRRRLANRRLALFH